jgi:hypothetical protein
VSIKQSKLKFQDKDYKIDCANKVCELHEANREIYIKVDVNDLNSVLVAPRNLDELKLYDHYQ